ncbi:hypothetical protein PSC71_01770 [Devosia sp. J2-20]|jgi:uncharacterized membrane protein YidH (DUF202 family)|uniref:Uncharacterized protein n=1 Tax=Devosia litorisediminis TaxID=2829817 RepID=A0A942E845_9HYPH|nr:MULTISPECIES: hypothetical protein [Devosia]MBS3847302.1 hypothetical protein [Devosia litorisediminis]WDQ99566.1 hypothetical protein PSC71_01770 [Devosia sp. J2-20]|tara:strand:+ start:1837 stop:2031 length:195 start_codon:yes stop_codon:yes gene_type:complete
MTDPKPSPFKLNRTRLFLLAMGVLVVLIAISTAMGGLSSYQQLKEAANEARAEAAATSAEAPAE